MIAAKTVSYAQNREDLLLAAFFDPDEEGFYVDVGANEPVHESVTKIFYDRGWSGINIEPIPTLHKKLVKERPRDINLQIGVAPKAGEIKLHYYPDGDGLSTMSSKMAESYDQSPNSFTSKKDVIDVKVLPLRTVLKENVANKKISFMKVDVEGYEYEVLSSNDWDKYRPEVICIEANHVDEDWRPLLNEKGYSFVFFDGLNEYYTDNNTDRKNKFDYIKGIIFKEPIINFRVLGDYKEYDEAVAWLGSEVEKQKEISQELQVENARLRDNLREISSLRRHILRSARYFAGKIDRKLQSLLAFRRAYRPAPINPELSLDTPNVSTATLTSDVANFNKFNKPPVSNPLLSLYMGIRNLLIKALLKTRRIIKGYM